MAIRLLLQGLKLLRAGVSSSRQQAASFPDGGNITLQVDVKHPLIGPPDVMESLGLLLRALIYKGLFYSLTALWVIILGFTLLWPNYKLALKGLSFWGDVNFFLIRHIVGIRIEIRGLEKLPLKGPYIVSPKHESTLDGLLAFRYIPDATALGKSEIFKVPVLGSVLRKMEIIPVERWGGEAHRDLPAVHEVIMESRRPILIFPEGTRVPQGQTRPLKPGAFHMQDDNNLKVFTVATNTGYFWGAGQLLMRPGLVIWEIHDAMPKGLDKQAFQQELYDRIIARSEELTAQARHKNDKVQS